MLRSHITIALRNLIHDRLTAGINIVGLSIAIAISLVLGLGVHGLLTADQHLAKDGLLFRVVAREISTSGDVLRTSFQREDLASTLTETFPEIDSATRVIKTSIMMTAGERHLNHSVVEVDAPFLRMFHYSLVAGDATTALDRLDHVVISQRLAERMFEGAANDYSQLIGRTIRFHGYQGTEAYIIGGVFGDLPRSRSLDFDAAIRFENRTKYSWSNRWDSPASTYVRLHPSADPAALSSKLGDFSRAFVEPVWERYRGVRWKDSPDAFQLELQPVGEIRLDPGVQSGYENSVGLDSVYVLMGMIAVILAIACINFTALSVARSVGRNTEIGIRKALGAGRIHILRQFLAEGVLMALISLAGGAGLVELGMPAFNAAYGMDAQTGLSLHSVEMPLLVAGGVVLTLLIGVVAGVYPALIAARMHPASAVRGGAGLVTRHRAMSLLLTVQYSMAVLLLICTVVIRQQLDFAQSRDLGYDAEQVVVVQLRGADTTQLGQRFQEAAGAVRGVSSVALAEREFSVSTSTTFIQRPDGERVSAYQFGIGPGFFSTLGIELTSGRSFEAGRTADRAGAVVINQSLADAYGWGEEAVGKMLPQFGNYGVNGSPTVIGVVPDFHFRSLKESIQPAIFHFGPQTPFRRVLVRIGTTRAQAQETLAELRQAWETVAADLPFEYEFLDDAFARQYQDDQEMNRIVTLASAVAAFVACMGLFGQATIVLLRRTKEIGVRKVLGATVAEVVAMLSRDLVKLVALACLVAYPLAYVLMRQWLSQYAYRIELGPAMFILCGSVAFAIALVTVGYVGVRAASANPAISLRQQ